MVVLPLPVGPVTRMMPWGIMSTSRNRLSEWPSKPSDGKSSTTLPLSSKRITTLSPYSVGTQETRRSSSRPCTRSLMRPSCGSLRSAMLSLAMIFTREITAAVERAGGASTSRSTPSMRYLTLSRLSNGSMWMSEARDSTARWISRLTSRTTGASLARSLRCSMSSSSTCSPVPMSSMIWPIAVLPVPYRRSKATSISERRPTRGTTFLPVASSTAWIT